MQKIVYKHQSFFTGFDTNTAVTTRGKWYDGSSMDNEISDDDVNNMTLPGKTGASADIYACGRASASSGCEVTFDIYDGNKKVCTIYFTCPWVTGSVNAVEVRDMSLDYPVVVPPYNRDHGALGRFDVQVFKRG